MSEEKLKCGKCGKEIINPARYSFPCPHCGEKEPWLNNFTREERNERAIYTTMFMVPMIWMVLWFVNSMAGCATPSWEFLPYWVKDPATSPIKFIGLGALITILFYQWVKPKC